MSADEFPPEWAEDVDPRTGEVDPERGELEPLLAGTEAPEAPAEPDPAMLYYPSVDVFVREKLIHSYMRAVGPQVQSRWSSEWWRSAEAISRLTAIWRAWEHLRQDPALGASTWWLNHADPHMRVLLDPDGPFARSTEESTVSSPLPHVDPPAGFFLPEPSIWSSESRR